MIRNDTKFYGLIGDDVSHSLSPKIHNNLFNHWNLNCIYLPLPVKNSNKNNIIKSLDTLNFCGANVTMPYKTTIIDQLDEVDPYAEKIKSVNTLVKKNGKWCGYSTDGAGFISSIDQLKIDLKNSKILVLGAGGAARAVSFILATIKKPNLIHIKDRTLLNEQQLINDLKDIYPKAAQFNSKNKYDVIINATNVGMYGDDLPIDEKLIDNAYAIIDLIYNPFKTTLLKVAEKKNKIWQNGIPMLLSQAIHSFEIWTGKVSSISLLKKYI